MPCHDPAPRICKLLEGNESGRQPRRVDSV